MRIIFLGSGAFGIPTLEALVKHHDVKLVITQPDRPAGRKQRPAPTPIAEFAKTHQLPILKPDDINDPAVIERARDIQPELNVVIAYGQKIGQEFRAIAPTINLHGSLLPKYRGAGPIQWAVLNGERETGVSIIDVADRMDAGAVYGEAKSAINPNETAGELHDRLALLGPQLMLDVIDQFRLGTAKSEAQDESAATRAPKLSKADGTVRFDQPADRVRAWVHGLTPWPGCAVLLDGVPLKLLRVEVAVPAGDVKNAPPGTLVEDGMVICASGAIRLSMVQPAGGKPMSFESYCNGRQIKPGACFRPVETEIADSEKVS